MYKLTPAGASLWTESAIYSFGASANDGAYPSAGVVFGANWSVLYGATANGGSSHCGLGCGTVFHLTSSGDTWIETLLHMFTGRRMAESPPAM